MTRSMLLLAEGFEALEASAFTDVFGWNRIEGDGSSGLDIVGLRPEIKATWNYKITVDHILAEVNVADYDALLIPGGFEEGNFYQDAFSPEFSEVIQQFNQAHKLIATICVGALTLGKAGILNGVKATTYTYGGMISARQRQLANFGAELLQQPIVESDNLITSWNPSTAVPVALRALARLTSEENAAEIGKRMGY
ncbi:DJ-1/PfpI family protein [Levilactobacillus bambusae]|uniref:DJ-1 family protein n=1 Tax=Levilactobacillus bambusae TaxID=2024736 RepID=A0A2V1MZM2_9LACO|nr:DJ-1/PfpI family protein [Levilactobacillus bambusae]PWG00429.1 DJ-1 family protein [Levilactobacillus bambusae]